MPRCRLPFAAWVSPSPTPKSVPNASSTTNPGLSLTVLASPSMVDVIIVDAGAGEDAVHSAADAVEEELREHVYGRDDTTLAETVLSLARTAHVRIGVAESCTGGLLSGALTRCPRLIRCLLRRSRHVRQRRQDLDLGC